MKHEDCSLSYNVHGNHILSVELTLEHDTCVHVYIVHCHDNTCVMHVYTVLQIFLLKLFSLKKIQESIRYFNMEGF